MDFKSHSHVLLCICCSKIDCHILLSFKERTEWNNKVRWVKVWCVWRDLYCLEFFLFSFPQNLSIILLNLFGMEEEGTSVMIMVSEDKCGKELKVWFHYLVLISFLAPSDSYDLFWNQRPCARWCWYIRKCIVSVRTQRGSAESTQERVAPVRLFFLQISISGCLPLLEFLPIAELTLNVALVLNSVICFCLTSAFLQSPYPLQLKAETEGFFLLFI